MLCVFTQGSTLGREHVGEVPWKAVINKTSYQVRRGKRGGQQERATWNRAAPALAGSDANARSDDCARGPGQSHRQLDAFH
jgi:hypothetical protein